MPTADKLPPTVAAVATYVAGEKPSGTKLSLIGGQLRTSATRLEQALGDIRSQRVPYIVDTGTGADAEEQSKLALKWGRSRTDGTALAGAVARELDIASVARLIGPASNLNPRMLGANNVTDVTVAGVYETALEFPVAISLVAAVDGRYPTLAVVAAAVGATDIASTDAAIVVGSYQAEPADLSATGEWTLDAVKGVVYTFDPNGGGTFTYPIDPLSFGGGSNYPGGRFNVIPDPNQRLAGAALTISVPVDGAYTIGLPTIGYFQGDPDGDTQTNDGPLHGLELLLPQVLDNYEVQPSGDLQAIPSGFVLLKHVDTHTVFDGGTYYYQDAQTLVLQGVDLPSTNGSEYVLITVGSDIITAIDDLRIKSRHSHDRSFGEPLIHVQDIYGQYESGPTAVGHSSPSAIPGNWFPQFLHREGWTAGQDPRNSDNGVFNYIRFLWDSSTVYTDPSSLFGRGLRWQGGSATEDIVLSMITQEDADVTGDMLSIYRADSPGSFIPDYTRDILRLAFYSKTFLLDDTYIGNSTGIPSPLGASVGLASHKLYFADEEHYIYKNHTVKGENLVAVAANGFTATNGLNPEHMNLVPLSGGGGIPSYAFEEEFGVRTAIYSGRFATPGSLSYGTNCVTISTSVPPYASGSNSGGLILGVQFLTVNMDVAPTIMLSESVGLFFASVDTSITNQEISLLNIAADVSTNYGYTMVVTYVNLV